MTYEPQVTEQVLTAVGARLARRRADLLEDIGTYLVSHSATEALRRLLRFGGVDYVDFLHSLEDLPERARLAVADLDLPALALQDRGGGFYQLHIGLPKGHDLRLGPVVVGLLRAMADDYGVLAMVEHHGEARGDEIIEVRLLDVGFADGRAFALAAGGACHDR